MDSILNTTKKAIGPTAQYEYFDPEIIMHINSVFMDLEQIGVGPSHFTIEDDTTLWSDFLPDDDLNLEAVKSYMFLRVKLLFDPPTNSSMVQAMERQVDKWEWRLNHAVETRSKEEK